jgi:hypothetical protein
MRELGRKSSAESLLTSNAGRHRSSTLRDLAPIPESTDLDAVDDDLKLNLAPAAEKSSVLVDILRALIHLRTRTLPILWQYIAKVFLADTAEGQGGGTGNISANADASLINRIFGKLRP